MRYGLTGFAVAVAFQLNARNYPVGTVFYKVCASGKLWSINVHFQNPTANWRDNREEFARQRLQWREELGWTRMPEQSVWMHMRELGGQSIPAVSDKDQYCKENMDKTEAYKVPGAEGRSWLWGFLPECQQSVNSLSNVTKIQLQDVIRRAQVGLIRGQPLEQKETVHTINTTRKNNWKEAHIFWLLANSRSQHLFQVLKSVMKSRIPSVPYVNWTGRNLSTGTYHATACGAM